MKKGIRKVVTCMMAVMILSAMIALPKAEAAAKIKLSKTKATICTGEKLQLKLRGTTKNVTWKTSKKSIATVNKNGVVTGKKKGKCVIKAKCGKKNYSCKLTVNPLPESYATINGKKVKVGNKVKITYKITAPKALTCVSAHYYYYGDQLQVLTSADDKMRFKTWYWEKGCEDAPALKSDMKYYKNMVKGETPMTAFFQCYRYNLKNGSWDPVSCKKGKEFDSFYVKVLKHGNFTFKSVFNVYGADNSDKKVKYTVKETIR